MADCCEAGQWYERLSSSNEEHEWTILASNYLSLGQFELARMTLRLLHNKYPDKAIHYLTRLAEVGIPTAWLTSNSVPTHHHLMWMCIKELYALRKLSGLPPPGPEIEAVARRAEFGMVLKKLCSVASGSPVAQTVEYELREYYTALEKVAADSVAGSPKPGSAEHGDDSSTMLLALSATTHAYLRRMFETDFQLAHSLCELIFSSAAIFRETTRQLYDTKVEVISEMLDRKNDQASEEACRLVQFLNFSKECVPTRIDELFHKLMRLYMPSPKTLLQIQTPITEEVVYQWSLWQRRVYNSLIAAVRDDKTNHALVHFMKLERVLVKADADASPAIAPPFLLLRSASSGVEPPKKVMNAFWSQYQTYISVTKKHFLEYAMLKGLEFLTNRQWADAQMVLAPFARMKPALLLMTWDKFASDIDAREQLLSMLWNDNIINSTPVDPDIASKARHLKYHVQLTRWCAKQISSDTGPFLALMKDSHPQKQQFQPSQIPNIVSDMLRRHSLLYVLHGHISRIPAEDIIGILKENPDSSPAGKQAVERELTVVHAYYAIKGVCDLINDSVISRPPADIVAKCMQTAKDHIIAIQDFSAQLTMLETLLWLIFTRASAWNKQSSFGAIMLKTASSNNLQKSGTSDSDENTDSTPPVDGFVCDGTIALPLITMLQSVLQQIPQSPEIHQRMVALTSRLEEGEWRAKFILSVPYLAAADATSSSADRQFMRFMVASPQSLIIRCIREYDFPNARRVIEFFNLTKSQHSDMVSLAEKVHQLRSQLPDDINAQNATGQDINGILHSLSDMEKFLITADIAICISKSKQQSLQFLEQARTLMSSFGAQSNNRLTDVSSQLMNYLNRLEVLLKADLSSWGLGPDAPLHKRLTLTDSFPTNATQLSAYIDARNTLTNVTAALQKVYRSPNNAAEVEAILQRVVRELGGPDNDPEEESAEERSSEANTSDEDSSAPLPHSARPPNARGGLPYLWSFCKQLLYLGNALKDENMGFKDYFDILRRRPNSILADLVFQSRNLKKAEAIAEKLDIDLIAVILDALAPGTLTTAFEDLSAPKTPVTSLKARLPRDSPSTSFDASSSTQPVFLNAFNSSQDAIMSPASSVSGLARTPTIMTPFESERRPWMPPEVLEYIRKESPIVAILACILRAPTDRIDPTLVENALQSSARAYPALHIWVQQKAKQLALFDSIYLQNRQDKVQALTTPNLGPANNRRRTEASKAVDELFGTSGTLKSSLAGGSRTGTNAPRPDFPSPHKDSTAAVYGDKEDPLALGNNLLFEPLFGPSKSQQSTPQHAPSRPRGSSSARRKLPLGDAPSSSTKNTPAIVDTSFPDSSDEEHHESPPKSRNIDINDTDHTEDGDIDLTSTPSSFSPSSFESYRHQLQLQVQQASTSSGANIHGVLGRPASSGNLLNSSLRTGAMDILPDATVAAGSAGSAIGASARSVTSLMQQQHPLQNQQQQQHAPNPTMRHSSSMNSIDSAALAAHQQVLSLFDNNLGERIVDSPEARKLLELIVRSDSLEAEFELYEKLVQHLMQAGRLERALTLADNMLPLGAPDELLLALIKKATSSSPEQGSASAADPPGSNSNDPRAQSWQLIMRLRDKTNAAPQLVLENLRSWELCTAIDMLYMCECHLAKAEYNSQASPAQIEILQKIRELHRRLLTYRDAFEEFQASIGQNNADNAAPESPSSRSRAPLDRDAVFNTLMTLNWQRLDDLCQRDLEGVINTLTDGDHYDVARKLVDHFKAANLKVKIEERYLLHLFHEKTDIRTVREKLLSLDRAEAIRVAESLLESVPTNEHRLFLIQFLMERKSEGSSGGTLGSLSKKELGVKILLRLPKDIQEIYQNYINQPLVIVESLFMSEQTSVLASIFKDIPQIRNDPVVIIYATKALDTARLTAPPPSVVVSDLSPSLESVGSPRTATGSILSSPMKRSSTTTLGRVPSANQINPAPTFTIPPAPITSSPSAHLSLFNGEESIESVREQHIFPSAPNHQLATAFLDLCYSARAAATKCIELCDTFSNQLQSVRDRLEIVRIIQQLLVYAKLRLMKEFDTNLDSDEPESRTDDGVPSRPTSPTPLSPPTSPRVINRSPSMPGSPFASSSFVGALQTASMSALVSLCDTLLSRIELLQQLLFSAPDLFQSQSLSLAVFADPTKIRQLRDKLLEQDRLDTALLVAAKCNIESEPVWSAKALQMLQSGRYQEAKQLFKYCLVSPLDDDDPPPPMVTMSRSTMGISVTPHKSVADNGPLLQKILRVLESGAPLDANDLRRRYNELVSKVQNQPGFAKKLASYSETGLDSMKLFNSLSKKQPTPAPHGKRKHTLDSLRYMQCIYYLQRYGTNEDLIQFWLRHGLIEDALHHVVNNHLDARYFNIIVMHSISHNLLPRIKELVARMESIKGKAPVLQEYLLATCKHLNQGEMYKLLLEFQLMMRDYVRAGLTCVKIFNRLPPQDFSARLFYLNLSRKYFQQGLEAPDVPANIDAASPTASSSSSSGSAPAPAAVAPQVASKSDVSKYIRTTNLQIRVTTFFQQNQKTIPADVLPPNTSLFQNAQRKAMIAETMIVLHNFDLAFAIVQEYRLPTQRIYQSALVVMATKKETKKIDELLKMVRPWLSESEWDDIVLAGIKVYMESHNDTGTADSLAARLRSENARLESLILMRKLKQAYLIAVKFSDIDLVRRIQEEAKRWDMKREYELCEKFLQSGGAQHPT